MNTMGKSTRRTKGAGGSGSGAKLRLHGLVVAAHTPFDAAGALNLGAVEVQAAHFLKRGLRTVFIGGSTGECHSLSTDERRMLCQRWMDVARGTELRVVVHVGSNCLTDAAMLARQAQDLDAAAVAALAPSYFKPLSVDGLVECCRTVASGAPDLPFYFYDIPVLTGVRFSMAEFLHVAAERIPNLAGIKFTNADLMAYQLCLRFRDGAYDVPWGIDEALLGALAVGARGAVGSSYNFAAPLYLKLLASFEGGEWDAARELQFRSVRVIQTLARLGYMQASKAVMGMIGVDVGPARLPHGRLTKEQLRTLRREVEGQGIL
jgi:N-acetylneuraminate lyase